MPNSQGFYSLAEVEASVDAMIAAQERERKLNNVSGIEQELKDLRAKYKIAQDELEARRKADATPTPKTPPAPPTAESEAAKLDPAKYFGPKSDARAANDLALKRPDVYKALKIRAREENIFHG